MEVDAVLQGDGTGEELVTGRHNDAPAALFRTEVDGLLDGFLVLGSRIGRLGAILGDYIRLVRELRYSDALLYLLVLGFIPLLCSCS